MKRSGSRFSIILSLLIQLLYCQLLPAQSSFFPVNDWINRLDTENIHRYSIIPEITSTLYKYDSATTFRLVNELKKKGENKSVLFQLRLMHLRAWGIASFVKQTRSEKVIPVLDILLKTAYETNNNDLVAYASWTYGSLMNYKTDIERVVTYKLKAVELYEQGEPFEKMYFDIIDLGQWSYYTREYRESIHYIQKGLAHLTDSSKYMPYHYRYACLNTIAQSYQQLDMPDSALYYLTMSYAMASKVKDSIWMGINALSLGQLYFQQHLFDKAKKEFYFSYITNKNKENSIAGNAINWYSKILLREKKYDSARLCLAEAVNLLDNAGAVNPIQTANYLAQTYYTKSELFRITGEQDSMNYFFTRYITLHDSLQTIISNSNSKIAQLRILNEKNSFAIKSLQTEKRIAQQNRNFIIAAISLLAIVTIIILNRQKRMLAYKEELARTQKAQLELEAAAARENLKLFTDALIEKTTLLENLQQQLQQKTLSAEQQEVLDELTHQTILTEEDWVKFKNLFEKIYPGFFAKLKDKNREVTLAEQRVAALSKLQLTVKEMASMLGISTDGVHKSRQRLRQRLPIPAETSLEEYLNTI